MVDETTTSAPQGRFLESSPEVLADRLCRACGEDKPAGLRVCTSCSYHLRGGEARREAENAELFPWYRLPDGWTWERVAIRRRAWGMPARTFPVGSERSVTTWAVPMTPGALAAHLAAGGHPSVVIMRSGQGAPPAA